MYSHFHPDHSAELVPLIFATKYPDSSRRQSPLTVVGGKGLNHFFAGLKVGVSVATIGAVIGEWVGAQRGLGYLMIQANARLNVDLVFAAILWLSAMGLSMWLLVGFLERKVIHWRS